MQTLLELNGEFRERYAANADMAGRAQAYELAARMQLAAPEVVDLSGEPKHVLDLYGIGADRRRMISAGSYCSPAGWRNRACASSRYATPAAATAAGTRMATSRPTGPLCRATDKPIAGLIRDLEQRGMLDETLVVWTSEFGRSPWSQNTTGRDHNPRGYTAWLAGGGVQGGTVHGATDEVGYQAVEDPHYCSDLHATILQQLGLDTRRWTIPVLGRTMRLVEESQGPIRKILGQARLAAS